MRTTAEIARAMFNRFAHSGLSFLSRVIRLVVSPQVIVLLFEPVFRLVGFRRQTAGFQLTRVKRVLVVRSDDIGDVVLSSPFLRELRRNLPTAWITLVVRPGTHNLAVCCPHVDEVLTYDWYIVGRGPVRDLRRLVRALVLARRHLWHRRFDVAICPRWDLDYYDANFVVYLSGAPYRVGYAWSPNEAFPRFKQSNRFFTELLANNATKHEVERGLDMIRFLGGTVRTENLELWTGENDEASVERLFRSHAVSPGELLISFGVGAGAAKRIWPIENFIELGRWLIDECNARIVVIGNLDEAPLGERLARQLGSRVINTVGCTTLREAGAILKRCTIHVGNDSGPMHLAAAAGVPVIEICCHPLNASTRHGNSPMRFGPWLVPHTVVQPQMPLSPCADECRADHAHCILGVDIERIKGAIDLQLSHANVQCLDLQR